MDTFGAAIQHAPIITKILNTAEPTIVPIPTSDSTKNVPTIDVNNSGADEPAAHKSSTSYIC